MAHTRCVAAVRSHCNGEPRPIHPGHRASCPPISAKIVALLPFASHVSRDFASRLPTSSGTVSPTPTDWHTKLGDGPPGSQGALMAAGRGRRTHIAAGDLQSDAGWGPEQGPRPTVSRSTVSRSTRSRSARRRPSHPGARTYRSGCGTARRSSPSIPAKSPGLQVNSGMSSAIAAAAIKAS